MCVYVRKTKCVCVCDRECVRKGICACLLESVCVYVYEEKSVVRECVERERMCWGGSVHVNG